MSEAERRDEVPTSVGGYPVERVLGRGGMGRVYACRDDALDRIVAVKVLLPELRAQPEMVGRFVREARAMAKVSSPHVVTVFAVGDDDGVPFLVMELLEGEDLLHRVKREGPLPIGTALSFALDATRGLMAAAAAGLVHRDVKPANLFIVDERVKLTDFGLARPADGSADLTQAGLVVGTPHYLAPELARGQPATIASDVYALGATLWEMVAGLPPFQGESALDVVTAHIMKPLPSLLEKRRDAPMGLVALLDEMLRKKPDERLRDYAALEARLVALLDEARAGRSAAAPAQTAQLALGTSTAPRPTSETPAVEHGSAASALFDLSPSSPETGIVAGEAAPKVTGPIATVKTASLTVMFTDIAGFTERTARQSREEGARWLALHDALLQPVFRAFGGKLVKTIGDAFLVTFTSPTDAVHCGCAIQDRLFLHNQSATPDARIEVRVALSAGEVRLQKGDIFGEPVNLAARLEALAEPGSVVFSDAVYATMNTAEVRVASRGEHQLKGISRPVVVYAAVPDGAAGAPPFGGRALQRVPEKSAALDVQNAARAVKQGFDGVVVAARGIGGRVPTASPAIRKAAPVFAAAAVLLAVVLGALAALKDDRLARIDRGEARAVLEDMKKVARAERTAKDELIRGHAHASLDEKRDAFEAYLAAAEKGEVDDRALSYALDALADERAGGAVRLLGAWPDASVEGKLTALLEDKSWDARHNAMDALEARGKLTDAVREKIGLMDARTGQTCQQRRSGMLLLKKHGKGDDALEAVRELGRQMPDNICMVLELASAEQAIKQRSK